MIRALLSHSVVYGLTTVAARGTLLVSLLVLPALLDPADYGALAMFAVAGHLVAAVVPLQVVQGLARHYGAADSPEEKMRYASSAWWFALGAHLLFLISGQAFAAWGTDQLVGDQDYRLVFRIALLVMVLNSLFFFLQSQFRFAFRQGEFVAVTMIYSITTLALSIGLALAWPAPLAGVVIGQALGGGAAVLWAVWRLRQILWLAPEAARLRELLRFSLPLVPAVLSVLLILYASRIVLNDTGTLADVGVLTFASQIAAIAGLAIAGVQAAITPLITAHHDEPGTPLALARVFHAFCAGAMIVTLGLGLFAAEGIALLGYASYSAAAPLVLPLALALLLAEMYIFAPGFWVAKRTGIQAAISVGAALLAFPAAYLLIDALGLLGAALSSFASAAVFLTCWWIVANRFYPVPVRWDRVLAYVSITGTIGAAGVALTDPLTISALLVKGGIVVLATILAILTGLVPWRDGMVAATLLFRRAPPSTLRP